MSYTDCNTHSSNILKYTAKQTGSEKIKHHQPAVVLSYCIIKFFLGNGLEVPLSEWLIWLHLLVKVILFIEMSNAQIICQWTKASFHWEWLNNLHCFNTSFCIPVRASDKHISHPSEYSDSEDEGDNRRDVHHAKEVKRSRKRAKGSATPVEKMVANGVDNAVNDDSKSTAVANENSSSKPSTSPVEEKEKPKSSTSTPKEGSPQTVASVAAEVSTEPAPEQEASRKRCASFLLLVY